jgi:hypothetical protein
VPQQHKHNQAATITLKRVQAASILTEQKMTEPTTGPCTALYDITAKVEEAATAYPSLMMRDTILLRTVTIYGKNKMRSSAPQTA